LDLAKLLVSGKGKYANAMTPKVAKKVPGTIKKVWPGSITSTTKSIMANAMRPQPIDGSNMLTHPSYTI
jgi:hypothetical protein